MRFGSVPIKVFKATSYDLYGQPTLVASKSEMCDVVKLATETQHTTVRVDSGGTRGKADETVADSILLVSRVTRIDRDDRVVVSNVPLRVTVVRPRFDIFGKIDHYELRCVACPLK